MNELFEVLPLDRAMAALVPQSPNQAVLALAERTVEGLPQDLRAAIWLYVDDLDRSHKISQSISGPVGAYWHGIMHRREGDFWNAKYWLRQVRGIDFGISGYEASKFVDLVEAANGSNPADLLDMQRKEWMALFSYCAENAGVKI